MQRISNKVAMGNDTSRYHTQSKRYFGKMKSKTITRAELRGNSGDCQPMAYAVAMSSFMSLAGSSMDLSAPKNDPMKVFV
jgi:hypothetical protein